jgi:hypothetical protein
MLSLVCAMQFVSLAAGSERMQVIGAGLGRTGTSSLRLALNQLGFKTLHMEDIIGESKPYIMKPAWSKFSTTPGVVELNYSSSHVDELLDAVSEAGFNASVDFPISPLYREQMARDPEAKVILTLRTSAEVWTESFMDTIARAGVVSRRFPINKIMPPNFYEMSMWMYRAVGIRFDDEGMPTRESAIEAYNSWAEQVKATVPAERLLIHYSKDGWEPLCKFLGVPVPSTPYPKAPNDRAHMMKMFGAFDFVGRYFFALVSVPLLLVLTCCKKCCGKASSKAKSS